MTAPLVTMSKYNQMVDILKSGIESGATPEGTRLASENELSRTYGISRNTVREAVSALVHQGYLSRLQGKGTFVLSRHPQRKSTSDAYAILLHARGHVFGNEVRMLVRAFQRERALPLVFDVEDIKSDRQADEILSRLLGEHVAGMVVEDAIANRVAVVSANTGLPVPPVVVLNYGDNVTLPAKRICSDFRKGFEIGTRHLLRLGRPRILMLTHRFYYAAPDVPLHEIAGMYGDTVRGYLDAMTEAGHADKQAYFLIEHELEVGSDERAAFKQLLASPNRPDAVFAFGDHRAKEVIDIAAEIGLRVPDDLAVLGYWNTPWAELTRVPLTSISIEEEAIAMEAAKALLQHRQGSAFEADAVVIPPRLVVRESCGATGA